MVAAKTQKMDQIMDDEEDEDIGFEEMGLDPRLLRAVLKKGLAKPTPIQLKAIPLVLEGKDIVARAKTGSGKTLAYLLPLVHKILGDVTGSASFTAPRAIVLVPTRELCQQVHDELRWLLDHCGGTLKMVQLTTNMSLQTLRAAMAGPPDIVVATPARISACITNAVLLPTSFQSSLHTLVLDEADLLLSYGYEDDLRKLAPHIPRRCQCLLMSATTSSDVEKLRKLILHNPITLTLMEESVDDSIVPKSVQQYLINCTTKDKLLYTFALLRFELIQKKGLIFVNSVDMGFRLKLYLEQFGIKSAVLNGELPQNSRLHILQEFNVGLFDYLIATDDGISSTPGTKVENRKESDEGDEMTKTLKAKGKTRFMDSEFGVVRGVDFKNVRTVINYDMPLTAAGYVHRIGRTGRAGAAGIAVSLVSPEEQEILDKIEDLLSDSSDVETKHIAPFRLLSKNAVESLRYRAEDVARTVTKIAVREARAKELRLEILNSDRLKAHFEDNPTDLELLKHDKVLSKRQPSFHLRTVPEYLRDPATEEACRIIQISRAAMGKHSQYKNRQSRKSGRNDPLKTFSAKTKRAREDDDGAGAGGKKFRKSTSGHGGSLKNTGHSSKKHRRRKR